MYFVQNQHLRSQQEELGVYLIIFCNRSFPLINWIVNKLSRVSEKLRVRAAFVCNIFHGCIIEPVIFSFERFYVCTQMWLIESLHRNIVTTEAWIGWYKAVSVPLNTLVRQGDSKGWLSLNAIKTLLNKYSRYRALNWLEL